MPQNRFCHLLGKKLSGEATDEEIVELELLMSQHPEWLFAAQHLFDVWMLQPKQDNESSLKFFETHLQRMEEMGVDIDPWQHYDEKILRRRLAFTKIGWIAAVTIVAICTFIFLKPVFFKNSPAAQTLSEVSTKMGSKSKLVLPDGSTVWLNAGSKLLYGKDFGTENRNVTLEGEAFFDVVKMPDLPFLIKTKTIQIKVLGTAFNVKSYADEAVTETSLVRGKVEITINKRPEEKFILNPNEKLTVSNAIVEDVRENIETEKKIPLVQKDRLTYRAEDTTAVEICWKENKLMFNDESFADVAKKLERWYDVHIAFTDEWLKEERITGSFTNETFTEALEALQITTPFHFSVQQNRITIQK